MDFSVGDLVKIKNQENNLGVVISISTTICPFQIDSLQKGKDYGYGYIWVASLDPSRREAISITWYR